MDSRQHKRETRFAVFQAQAIVPSPTSVPEDNPEQSIGTPRSPKRQERHAAEGKRPRKILKGSPKPLVPSTRDGLGPVMRNGSPWDTYKIIFTCELAGTVSICEHRRQASKVVAIRTLAWLDGEGALRNYMCLNHINIITAVDCFKNDGLFHFIVEDLPLTLEHLVAIDAYPTEVQLASILKQVMDGLSYLHGFGYHHPLLECSTTLMTMNGVVKIANLESIVPFTPEAIQHSSVKRLGFLAMELMQKYVKENVGIDDTVRWPIDSKAFDFLSATTSARSVIELSQHALISISSSASSLSGLARLAIVSACTFYSYDE